MIFALTMVVETGCEKKETNSNPCDCTKIVDYVQYENIEGIVNYDKKIEKWLITYHEPGTYDNIRLFIPCVLGDDFKKNDTKVLLSGKSFNLNITLEVPAGSKYSCIELQGIEILN